VKVKIALQFLGIALTIIGYLGGNAEKLPFVSRIVAPNYFLAKEGMKTLSIKKVLGPQDLGFTQIAEIFRKQLKPKEAAEKAQFEKLALGAGGMRFATGAPAEPFVELEIFIKGNASLKADLTKLGKDIDAMMDKRIFAIANIVFWLGVAVSIPLVFLG
jgi:hypothetical protein